MRHIKELPGLLHSAADAEPLSPPPPTEVTVEGKSLLVARNRLFRTFVGSWDKDERARALYQLHKDFSLEEAKALMPQGCSVQGLDDILSAEFLPTSFSAGNYRAFSEKFSIELAPVTLLFGSNNAGKSAVTRLLPLIAESCGQKDRAGLNPSAECLRGSRALDVLCRQDPSQELYLGVGWNAHSVECTLRPDSGNNLELSSVNFLKKDKQYLAEKMPSNSLYRLVGTPHSGIFAEGLTLTPDVGLPEYLEEYSGKLGRLVKQVSWLEASRVIAGEEPLPQATGGVRIGSKGQHALAACSLHSEVLSFVTKWFKDSFDQQFVLREVGDRIKAELTTKGSPFSVALADCGEGFSQVLPVVAAAALASSGLGPPIVCMEHPELHLHPDAHGSIASLLCRAVSRGSRARFIVETHSENLLLGLLIAVVKRRIPVDSIKMYWVRQLHNGTSKLDQVSISPDGRLDGKFPADTFRRDTELSRELLNARKDRSHDI